MGLPGPDNRRIIPVTAPDRNAAGTRLEGIPGAHAGEAAGYRPTKAVIKEAEPMCPDGRALSNGRTGYLEQVVHQTTHSLARFFLEIDANYKQFQTARGCGRRRKTARITAGLLRGRPDHRSIGCWTPSASAPAVAPKPSTSRLTTFRSCDRRGEGHASRLSRRLKLRRGQRC